MDLYLPQCSVYFHFFLVDLQRFLRFCSGGIHIPRRVTVHFSEGETIYSSTCLLNLQLPKSIDSYETFKLALHAVINDTGDAFNSMWVSFKMQLHEHTCIAS